MCRKLPWILQSRQNQPVTRAARMFRNDMPCIKNKCCYFSERGQRKRRRHHYLGRNEHFKCIALALQSVSRRYYAERRVENTSVSHNIHTKVWHNQYVFKLNFIGRVDGCHKDTLKSNRRGKKGPEPPNSKRKVTKVGQFELKVQAIHSGLLLQYEGEIFTRRAIVTRP